MEKSTIKNDPLLKEKLAALGLEIKEKEWEDDEEEVFEELDPDLKEGTTTDL